MNTELRTLRRGLALSVGLLLGGACHSSPAAPAQSADPARASFDSTVAALGPWNGGLKDTTHVDPVPKPQTVLTASNGDNWVCQNTQFDDKKNLDQMLTPGLTAGVMWPGALIQGRGLIAGEPAEIPLPRSPITISIDLAVDTPSARIAAPTSASVQSAIADLQRQADTRLGKIDVVPARIDYRKTESFSDSQASVDVGIHGAFPVKGVDFTAGVSVRDSTSFQKHTITVTLIQPMYTISFADEEKVDPNAYLADSVTAAQVQDVVNRGLIGADNQPVYVKSVTYGRMLVFTLTNDSTASALDVEVAIGASVAAFKASTNDSVAVKNQQVLRNTDLHIQAFGGSQDSALAAIRADSLAKFFTAVAATQAVPLSYRVNYLKDGTVALLGAETKFTRSDCANSNSQGRYWHVQLQSLTSNGGCDSANYVRQAILTTEDGFQNVRAVFPLLDVRSGPMADTTVNRDVVVLLSPSGPVVTMFVTTNFFLDSLFSATGGILEKDFTQAQQFAVNPYVFTHIITLPGASDACTVTFTYQLFLEPALSPPRRVALGR